ncbi:ABC transporter ATP-binding protein [Rhodoplanes sp. TEM]|uniref:ABC transporter ATP-binding protein n=1 Tax=Rhodoplanes tepidamans TaxID=200616 RepID=A0ABT5JFR7_RHOTP|nr:MULTISPECIES: ABC transporter ATP-binding protein [Rhodoplanes]MDC7788545.1 ABC transporter ATP-binding protein [Rhodoplanes tepidamans]MDC7985144.1 ABC transporter ATP-binding protein [Rhodoplanes sp. TEM]MDQ0353396.1 NitT/TauT family transport system ATP-binding protein [Rhodoplanes tepidamans]
MTPAPDSTAATSSPGLVVEAVSHAFGPEPVLTEVSFALPAGKVGCLIGPSGCGKSTLLAMIGGLSRPDQGRIVHAFVRPAFAFQDPCLLPWRDARQNIAFGLKALPMGRTERDARAERLLGIVGLSEDDGDKFPHELSGGMRQRVALARALAIDPDLVLLDEPFSALDVGLRRQMQALVQRLIDARGLTTVLVTHDLAEAVRMADRIVVLSPRPARVAALHDIAVPHAARDDGFVHAEVGRLLADPATARALAVEPEASR